MNELKQLSLFDLAEPQETGQKTADGIATYRSCRNCKHASILRFPKPIPGYGKDVFVHGYCFKHESNRYPIYIPDGECTQWTERRMRNERI